METKIPSLTELTNASLKEIEHYAPHLSSSEILILGAKPLINPPRAVEEHKFFHDLYLANAETVEDQKREILNLTLKLWFDKFNSRLIPVKNYLDKYQFLLENQEEFQPYIDRLDEVIQANATKWNKVVQ